MKSARLSAACSLLAWTVLACAPGPGTTDPCRFDVVECRDPEGFVIDPDCTPEEPLVVALGQGEGAFEPFGPGEIPGIYYGSQGGQHLFGALRLENPDPDHSLFRCRFSYLAPGGDAGLSEVAERVLVFQGGDAEPLEGGGLELASVLLRLPDDPSEVVGDTNRLELVVEDSCGRRGARIHEFTW